MGKIFKLVKRDTKEPFKPDKRYKRHYVVLYDSGYAAIVVEDFYTTITPADPKEWEIVYK